jgi:hypothetical protein
MNKSKNIYILNLNELKKELKKEESLRDTSKTNNNKMKINILKKLINEKEKQANINNNTNNNNTNNIDDLINEMSKYESYEELYNKDILGDRMMENRDYIDEKYAFEIERDEKNNKLMDRLNSELEVRISGFNKNIISKPYEYDDENNFDKAFENIPNNDFRFKKILGKK